MPCRAQATAVGNKARKAAASAFPVEWIGRQLGHAERRRVAVLSVGIVSSEGGIDRSLPGEMDFAIVRYQKEARRCIEHFGGRVIGQLGTSMVACWGLPGS